MPTKTQDPSGDNIALATAYRGEEKIPSTLNFSPLPAAIFSTPPSRVSIFLGMAELPTQPFLSKATFQSYTALFLSPLYCCVQL